MTPAEAIRETLRADLKSAMLAKERDRATLIRTLIAAIDNAEAVEATAEQQSVTFRKLGDPSGEVARRELTTQDIAAVLEREVASRLEAAAQYRERGSDMEAAQLEVEAQAAATYLWRSGGFPGSGAIGV